jgi:hypothetical protein
MAKIELFSTSVPHYRPFECAGDNSVELLEEFDTLEEAARYADTVGCGWYLWSRPERGQYLGTICVVPGANAEVKEF